MFGKAATVRVYKRSSKTAGPLYYYLLLMLAGFLTGCSTLDVNPLAIEQIAPLEFENRVLSVAEIELTTPAPDLLAVDDEMRQFVERYVGDLPTGRQRLHMLHRSLKGAGVLNIIYEPGAGGTAGDVFHRESANCLSYAHLFVAMAREAGLDAHYQWLEVRPQWSLMGERIAVRLHVNVVVHLNRGEKYMVDIDPLPSHDIAGSRALSDADAAALFHSNLAMDLLVAEDIEQSWSHAVRALQMSPEMSHLWVNLGVIYRRVGQLREAERAYLYALQLDSRDRSAMNNLVVLYELEGRNGEYGYWVDRIKRYRKSNPYYHAWLGDQAGETENWSLALTHYQTALALAPQESRLLYAVGLIHYRLGDFGAASHYIRRAIDTATLRRDIDTYQLQLDLVLREQVAGL
ncbi:MAG: tetratricopeptide repeat protein [Halieaceae bacterium]|jgi:tetratricopeptide (TPR) repeat protein|nr:tetratricopeptide repeat protein [Halieaceae bacterium]